MHIIYIFIVQAPSILWKLEGGDGIEEVFFGSSKNGRGMKHGDKSRFLGPSYSTRKATQNDFKAVSDIFCESEPWLMI